jgi:UDP-N-acetylglucosamine--N-acetylmuramyl-(pentapeptide) pyrophosphoryl-undecaprenol N-acetylglucosamine transferase
MKVLFVVTGRGIGGDAVIALNIAKALSKYDIQSEFALDHTAPGLLFKKKGIEWHKTSIPQAGGHAATKKTLVNAGFKTAKAVIEAAKMFRKINPDVVVGVIGGGAVVGCLTAKITNIPSIGILNTPTDAKVCTKITTTVALPESTLFQTELQNKNINKAYSPVDPEIIVGNRENALKHMPDAFDENLPTILLSSGSTIFEKMAVAASNLGKSGIKANIILVGEPLEEEYNKYFDNKIDNNKLIYLGYINWINDLYKIVDIAVVTDDGMMIHEAMTWGIPVVALLGVKYGRYHNLAAVFKGAVLESELENLEDVLGDAFANMDKMKDNAVKYGEEVLKSSDKIARIICASAKKK